MLLSKEQIAQFEKDGYLVIENFLDPTQCQNLISEAHKIIEKIIDTTNLEDIPVFPIVSKDSKLSESELDYFENSADDIKLFLNHNEFVTDKHRDIQAHAKVLHKKANRLAHALHALNPVFREVTFSPNVKDIVKSFGYTKPIVCQSMYFMLQGPKYRATGHQTCTYVVLEPSELLGFCIAVTDSTTENGCLEVIPGSHKREELKNKFVRTKKSREAGERFDYIEGEPDYPNEGYISIPLKAGSLVLKDGLLIQRVSECQVHEPSFIYSFHVYDADKSNFSEKNWMKYNEKTFLPLFETRED